MKREAKTILREELKAKGLTSAQINEMFSSWNEKLEDVKSEDSEDDTPKDKAVRHGTTCFGIISPAKKKTLTEF